MLNRHFIKIFLLTVSSTLIYPFYIHSMEKNTLTNKKNNLDKKNILNKTSLKESPVAIKNILNKQTQIFKKKKKFKPDIHSENVSSMDRFLHIQNRINEARIEQNKALLFTLLISGGLLAGTYVWLRYSSQGIRDEFFSIMSNLSVYYPFLCRKNSYSRWLTWWFLHSD